jgi:SAM-dependent methyltransferase
MDPRLESLQTSYDRVASEYAHRLFDELSHKPLDRALLDCFASEVRALGAVADIGCGPGQIARYLHERGVPVVGIDLSPGMVATAQRLTPAVPFRQGSMLSLDVEDGTWGGVVALYVIVHLSPDEVPGALAELYRVLRPGGLLLLSFHLGTECVHRDEWWGHAVSLDFYFHEWEPVLRDMTAAGFEIEARVERRPYEAVEYPSQRAYLLARKPHGAVEQARRSG